jgi:hypothetical protein
MKKIIAFKVCENYRVWLRFNDGVEGEADFSPQVGLGVFAVWTDYTVFQQVFIGEHGRTLVWPGELDFCADALWLQITEKAPEELFPNLKKERMAYAHP